MEYYSTVNIVPLFAHANECNTDLWDNMSEPWEYYAQWKKPVTMPYILWLHLYEISEKGKAIKTVDSRDGVEWVEGY